MKKKRDSRNDCIMKKSDDNLILPSIMTLNHEQDLNLYIIQIPRNNKVFIISA